MAITHTITRSFATSQGNPTTAEKTETINSESQYSESIADSTTDEEAPFLVDVSAAKTIMLNSDQDVTLEFNDGTTPDQTINLKANCPVIWHEDDVASCPIDQDTTKVFITNSSGSAAQVDLICGMA